MPQLLVTALKVQWPLRFAFSYVQPVTQRYKQKTVEVPLQNVLHGPMINYCLENAAAITLHFQLCSARFTVLQVKNSDRIVSAINPVTMEIPVFTNTL